MADPFLRDLSVSDSEGVRWAVLQRWMKQLSNAEAGDVHSILGTPGQVNVSNPTGIVTLSLPTAITGVNSIASVPGSNLVLKTGTFGTVLTFGNSGGAATFGPGGIANIPTSTTNPNFTGSGVVFFANTGGVSFDVSGSAGVSANIAMRTASYNASNLIYLEESTGKVFLRWFGAGGIHVHSTTPAFTIDGATTSVSTGTGSLINAGGFGNAGTANIGGTFIGAGALNGFNMAAGLTPATELEVDSTSVASPRGIMSAQFNNGTDGARFHGRKARGTRAVPLVIVTADNLTRWVGSGYDGSNYLEMASIIFGTEGTIAATRVPTNITFQTATNATPSVLTTAMVIASTQLIRFNAYGAGAITADASGNLTAVSDERVKRDIRPYRRGLREILALSPILHGYSRASGLDQTKDDYAGFSAQNVQRVIPEAIGRMNDGMMTLSDRPIIAALVNAIAELTAQLNALRA